MRLVSLAHVFETHPTVLCTNSLVLGRTYDEVSNNLKKANNVSEVDYQSLDVRKNEILKQIDLKNQERAKYWTI